MKIIRFIKPEDTYFIRQEVLRKNIDLPYQFDGDFDETTFHLGVFVDNKLVSIASIMKTNNELFIGEQCQLRGMATLKANRGKGYGKMLIQKAEQILKEKNTNLIWCNARIGAVAFYKRLDFIIIGNPFDVPKIGKHYLMYKKFS